MSDERDSDKSNSEGSKTESKPRRDARGRYVKGCSGNVKGRPKKKRPEPVPYQGDIRWFANLMIEVNSNGERQSMDRRTALLNKMYESAMKGRVSMQRFLYQEFERNAKRLAEARVRYEKLQMEWIFNNPNFKDPDFEIPIEIEVEMLQLRHTLHHYYPDEYPLGGPPEVDEDDEDEGT